MRFFSIFFLIFFAIFFTIFCSIQKIKINIRFEIHGPRTAYLFARCDKPKKNYLKNGQQLGGHLAVKGVAHMRRPGGACVVSGAKKKSFDRGCPVWPPWSNVTNDRSRGGLGGLCAPSQKPGNLGGRAPSQNRKIFAGGQTPRYLAGEAKDHSPPPKGSYLAFDRGGQTGQPRSSAFFSAPLTIKITSPERPPNALPRWTGQNTTTTTRR